jgi:hypothetical protein
MKLSDDKKSIKIEPNDSCYFLFKEADKMRTKAHRLANKLQDITKLGKMAAQIAFGSVETYLDEQHPGLRKSKRGLKFEVGSDDVVIQFIDHGDPKDESCEGCDDKEPASEKDESLPDNVREFIKQAKQLGEKLGIPFGGVAVASKEKAAELNLTELELEGGTAPSLDKIRIVDSHRKPTTISKN